MGDRRAPRPGRQPPARVGRIQRTRGRSRSAARRLPALCPTAWRRRREVSFPIDRKKAAPVPVMARMRSARTRRRVSGRPAPACSATAARITRANPDVTGPRPDAPRAKRSERERSAPGRQPRADCACPRREGSNRLCRRDCSQREREPRRAGQVAPTSEPSASRKVTSSAIRRMPCSRTPESQWRAGPRPGKTASGAISKRG